MEFEDTEIEDMEITEAGITQATHDPRPAATGPAPRTGHGGGVPPGRPDVTRGVAGVSQGCHQGYGSAPPLRLGHRA